MNYKKLLQDAESMFDYSQRLRRDFHQHPELGFQEIRTARIIADELKALNLQVQTDVAQTGVVAIIEGAHPGPVVMLRFDMDALPINEETGAPYSSKNQGVMHACGHDGHAAIGLTAAHLLLSRTSEFNGLIKLVYQPAEEGLGGAERMIADGVLNNPEPDYCLGLHLWNEKPLGWIGATPGPVMAAADVVKIRIVGRGGHGAQPHLAYDPLIASAQIVMSSQSIVSRNISPLQSAVVSLTMIHGGSAFNVIPGQIEIEGTIRTFDLDVRTKVIERLETICESTSRAHNCTASMEIQSLTPAVVNHPAATRRIKSLATNLYPDSIVDEDFRTMGSEDMAFFLQRIPGSFLFLGSANTDNGLNAPHHHPGFDFDERVLTRASALIVGAALDYLSD